MVPRLYEGMSLREISEFLFCEDALSPADLIILFGGKRPERAIRAAELYKAGFALRIVITGGDRRGLGQCEAEMLRDICLEMGVPAEAILIECESVNSMENVRMSAALVEAQIGWRNIQHVILVSAPHHLRRIKQTMSHHVPKHVRLTCCADARTDVTRENWWHTPQGQRTVYRELEKVRTYAIHGEF